ncbi:tetratricopeptide repeat protein [bacterium]|nr:tetratricopeptide repeat protein [bacterium]
MLEQTINRSNFSENVEKAKKSLERAREAHERYLLKLQSQDLETAIEYYIDAIKLDPGMPDAYYRLATLLWENGQIGLQTAIEQCKKAISLAPKNLNAHMYTGYFLKMAQDYNSAEKEFKRAIKIGGINSARPRLILSLSILQKMANEKHSFFDFARCLYYLISGSAMIFWDFASLKMIYKNFNEDFSVLSYRKAGEFLEKIKKDNLAKKIYEKGAIKTEKNELFYQKIADIYVKEENMDEAVNCYKRVLESNPQNRTALVKLATVNQTFFPENVDESIDCYNKLLEIESDKAPIYYELGHLYLKKEDKVHSICAFKLALENDSENPFYNNALAYAFVQAELYDDAIEYYQKAIKLNPDKKWTALVCQALGSIYAQASENNEAAIASFQAGIILDPDNAEIYMSLGDVYMAENDLDKAIRAYCDAISVDASDYRAFSKTGLALWEKDYLEEAIVAYTKAIDLNPDYDIAQNNLGVIYLDGIGTPKQALPFFKRAIEINPNYTLAYFNAGRSLQALGKNEESAKFYQMAMDLNKITSELDEDDIKERLFGLFNT